jgi:hypothetical protein
MADAEEITISAIVSAAKMAFEARATAIIDMLDGSDRVEGRTRPYADRCTVSLDVDGRADLFIWARDIAGASCLLSAPVPPNSAPFMVARQLAEQYVAARMVELMECPTRSL